MRTVFRQLQASRFAREILLIGAAYMAYEIVRSISADRFLDAFENTQLVVRAEQALGIFAELNVQVAMLSYDGLIDFLSLWYFWGHFPLLIVFALWAFYRHRRQYVWARNSIFVAGGIALVVYVLFPVAPPRLLPGAGFADTLRGVFALQYDDSSLVNELAAIPSLHQGFAVIVGGALYRIVRGGRGIALLVLLPTLMFVSIVATGNHWFVDAILGGLVAVAGMVGATRLERHGSRLTRAVRQRVAHLPTALSR